MQESALRSARALCEARETDVLEKGGRPLQSHEVLLPRVPYRRSALPASPEDSAARFYRLMNERRTIRAFSERPVPKEVIEHCLRAAGTAPSGAHRQPWMFCVVSDPAVKAQIREAAEREEHAFYQQRAPREMLDALAPLGTDAQKPYLEKAPFLIAIFAQSHQVLPDGSRNVNYYATQSVGIATGMLITALHQAGLATLTHTPSPMGFLSTILNRPVHEKPFMLLVTGYPEEGATVPDMGRKALDEIAVFYE